MNTKREIKFPNVFFTQSRPIVNTKEALKNFIPIKWSKEVMSFKRKAIVYSVKEKNHNNKYLFCNY